MISIESLAGRGPVTLVDVARFRAQRTPEKPAYSFVGEDLEIEAQLSYAELDRGACAIADELSSRTKLELDGTAPRVLLVFPPGLDYVQAFFGCLYGGFVAVPTYPPRTGGDGAIARVVADCRPQAILTTPELAEQLAAADWFRELGPVLIVSTAVPASTTSRHTPPTPAHVAFLQYTSGSTGNPKGVVVTHENLMHNQQVIADCYGTQESDEWFTWLPMYHDMGLIGTILHPLYRGSHVRLASPFHFIRRPRFWLEAITRFRVNVSGGPNFAYQLCLERLPVEQLAGLDLSSWRIAFNGAEPVLPATLRAFSEHFSPVGFQGDALRPSYGLAEATLCVTTSGLGAPAVVGRYDRALLEKNVARKSTAASPAAELSGCGPSTTRGVVIADPDSRAPVAEGGVGEIWVNSRSVAAGYWNKPELSEHTFRARLSSGDARTFLRTGDLGFVENGELFVTGRLKDLIIVRGRNYYAQDIEQIAEASHECLRPGGSAAFTVDEGQSDAGMVVVLEVARTHLKTLDAPQVCDRVRRAVGEQLGLPIYDVVLLKPGTVPKTTSGKVRRSESRKLWAAGSLPRLNELGSTGAVPAATLTAAEQRLAQLWQRVLGVTVSGPQADLFQYGADSVKVVELAHAAEQEFGWKVPIRALYESSSLSEMASMLESKVARLRHVDLDREATLPADLQLPAAPAGDGPARELLVTGATGYLGSFLVAELLSLDDVRVTCIVRASSDENATLRVHEALDAQGLNVDRSRLLALAGDLSKPQLGLADATYQGLAQRLDAIYHSAAAVDWAKPYERLKGPNVDATLQVIRLACAERLKAIHHVSTMWVFPLGRGGDPSHPIDMEGHFPRCEGLETGYNKSKWVAERLVARARDLGVPVTIHRMDFITAASGNGTFKLTDLVPRIVRDAVTLGILPSDDVRLDLIPVDALAKMIVALSRSSTALGKAFHLLNHERLSLSSLARMLGEAGYAIERVPYAAWKERISEDVRSAMFPLVPLLDSYDAEDLALSLKQGADNRQALEHLAALTPGLARSLPSMQQVTTQLIRELQRVSLISPPMAPAGGAE